MSTSTDTTILFDRSPAPTQTVGSREQPRRSYLSSRRDGPEVNESRADHSAHRTAGRAIEAWTAIWTKFFVGRPSAGTLEGASALVCALWDDAATRNIALTVTRGRFGAPTNKPEGMDHIAKMQLEVDVAAWERRREKLITGEQVGKPRETG